MKNKDPFVVSDKTCKGCCYYSYLSGNGVRCCDYTCVTGKLRPKDEPCAKCSVKRLGKRLTTRDWVSRNLINGRNKK